MRISIIIQYNVPFSRKEEAKREYMKWDKIDKKWFNEIIYNSTIEEMIESLEIIYEAMREISINFEIHNIKFGVDKHNDLFKNKK